jgi:predicted Zn-dependent protease
MASSRIELFKQMLESDPINTSVLFGLAKEYEKSGDDDEMIATLQDYLTHAEDEGNAYGMLARAYERLNRRDEARETYQRGMAAAQAHGHPGMVEEYKVILEEEYDGLNKSPDV